MSVQGLPLERLIYLSHPFGGRSVNLERAQLWLGWAHRHTPFGLWVICPWLPSARSELARGGTEEDWRRSGGMKVEAATLAACAGVLTVGPSMDSVGMNREVNFHGLQFDVTHHGLQYPPPYPLKMRRIEHMRSS